MNFIELYFNYPEKPEPFTPNKMDGFLPVERGFDFGQYHGLAEKDERGHLSVAANATHERPSHLWTDDELDQVAAQRAAMRESDRISRGEEECPF